ncbi:MAG: hypothetical protein SXQ77_03170, partial [Halobacteria archaeon]|nr:hypothetical protein [Halobacteria archaeon]
MQFVYNGEPSDTAVTATQNLILYDGNYLMLNKSSQFTETRQCLRDVRNHTCLGESGNHTYPIQDVVTGNPDPPVYNVVEVKMTLWKT